MKLLQWGPDGGDKSTVMGFYIIEIKWLFSIVLLRFGEGSRENYHSHAFNAITFWLYGTVIEYVRNPPMASRAWSGPSLIPKFTPRSRLHKVFGIRTMWALSLRGPWSKTWVEYLPASQEFVTLTHGRKQV